MWRQQTQRPWFCRLQVPEFQEWKEGRRIVAIDETSDRRPPIAALDGPPTAHAGRPAGRISPPPNPQSNRSPRTEPPINQSPAAAPRSAAAQCTLQPPSPENPSSGEAHAGRGYRPAAGCSSLSLLLVFFERTRGKYTR